MNTTGYSISKTSFIKFEQCAKAFFFYKNHPYLRDKIGVDKQLTFKRGHDIGSLAQQLFPGGIDVSKETKNLHQAAELTNRLVEEKVPVIYEATFIFNGVLIMIDILVLENDSYQGYEVKSSLKISDTYLKDACLQYYVLKNCLPDFNDLFLVTINPEYILEGELDIKKLFRKRSVKTRAEENLNYFEHRIREAQLIIEQNAIPNVAIGKQCFKPYQCDFFGTCWKDNVSEDSIFNLPLIDRGLLFEWFSNGTRSIHQVNDEMIEKEVPRKIKNAILHKKEIIDHEKIEGFLSLIEGPVAAMDMEIWNPAVPKLQGTRPFEQIPFLVSFYNGANTFFFTDHPGDERKQFGEKLIELSVVYKTILVYDKTMEVSVVNSLIQSYPELKEGLEGLKQKMVDVFDVFLSLAFYDPAFGSNFSLKVVTSKLLKDVLYSKIGSGLEAMAYFDQYRLSEDESEKTGIKEELINYCGTDTEATYKLVEFLRNLRT